MKQAPWDGFLWLPRLRIGMAVGTISSGEN
jgi:hypothetical protein